MVSDARLLIFFSMFLCLFLMFSRVLRMARIFWFLQRGLSKKCQRGVLKNTMSLCNPFWHFFCKSVWHFTIFPKPLPESDSHMHHTHAPSENENFPSAKPPAWTFFLSFFPSHFRSSFRLNNPVPVSLLSGDRKPQIRFLGNHHSGSGNLYHKSFRM